jgi:hypothetical protein
MNATGTLLWSPRVLGTSHIGTGVTVVSFDRVVTGCLVNATLLGDPGMVAGVALFATSQVRVKTYNKSGAPADLPTYLELSC